ncbi:hypothetical protein PUN28_001063 [Cardiocondyla obscurior]|uniref:Secreted protein n=1 Tax=Cardiocondyla obscurior TaxID=286306 RepID=A0AAW2H342_9HYME
MVFIVVAIVVVGILFHSVQPILPVHPSCTVPPSLFASSTFPSSALTSVFSHRAPISRVAIAFIIDRVPSRAHTFLSFGRSSCVNRGSNLRRILDHHARSRPFRVASESGCVAFRSSKQSAESLFAHRSPVLEELDKRDGAIAARRRFATPTGCGLSEALGRMRVVAA